MKGRIVPKGTGTPVGTGRILPKGAYPAPDFKRRRPGNKYATQALKKRT